jgi:hypothetical protein
MKDTKAAVNQFTIVAIDMMSGYTISGKYSQTMGPMVKLNIARIEQSPKMMTALGSHATVPDSLSNTPFQKKPRQMDNCMTAITISPF